MDGIPSNHRLAERQLIRLVQSGRWRIDGEGRIWIAVLWTGRVVEPAYRAEKRVPAGYLMVRAMLGGRRVVGLAHRLVWQHLHGDVVDGHVINHINGQKADNRPSNLEETNYSGNMKHAHRTGLADEHGEDNPAAKLTDHQVAEIRLAYAAGGYTMQRLATQYGVTFQHISDLVRGRDRPKQAGPILTHDLRHNACDRDQGTGRFIGRRTANG